VSVAPRCSAPPDEHRNRARVRLAASLPRSPKRRTSSLRQATCDLVGRIAMESTPASPEGLGGGVQPTLLDHLGVLRVDYAQR
jgi:hypothetical protein